MTDATKEDIDETSLRFIRFKSIPEDIVGKVLFFDDHIIVKEPVSVYVDTILEEGRQILSIKEYLPQAIIKTKEVSFDKEEILLMCEVREDFKEQYKSAASFFYTYMDELEEKPKKRKKPSSDEGNVINLVDALRAKDNVVH